MVLMQWEVCNLSVELLVMDLRAVWQVQVLLPLQELLLRVEMEVLAELGQLLMPEDWSVSIVLTE
jgi:hypothetical protein